VFAVVTAFKTKIELVAHLMRRAAFGLPAYRLEQLADQRYEDLVEDLLDIESKHRPEEDLLERFLSEHADEENSAMTAARWYFRMINSERVLEEKVALFWHNRFATGIAKSNVNLMMWAHLEMLRDHGMGNFRVILQKLSRDPAMIWWLDQQTNHKGAINENYGRELLELFSMGRGNYTEDDVQAAALAFTGWTLDQSIPRYPNGWWDFSFVYREDDHDHTQKTFLGRTDDLNGDDVIDEVVKHEATARFVADNIYRYFVSDEPNEAEVEALMKVYFESDYEIKPLLRYVFNSESFKNAAYQKVRWPVDHVVNIVNITGRHTDPYEGGLKKLAEASALMGQRLLDPPSVEGWHTGREWIDSSFLIERVNFAARMLGDTTSPGMRKIIERISTGKTSITPNQLVDACLYELGCVEISEKTRAILREESKLPETIRVDDSFDDMVAQTIEIIVSSREYQLG
jgi:uncharacterized protein (DUF1800 family)